MEGRRVEVLVVLLFCVECALSGEDATSSVLSTPAPSIMNYPEVLAPSAPFHIGPRQDTAAEPTFLGLNYYLAIYILVGSGVLLFFLCVAIGICCCARRRRKRRDLLYRGEMAIHHHQPVEQDARTLSGEREVKLRSGNETSFTFPSLPAVDSDSSRQHQRRDSEEDDLDSDWRYGHAPDGILNAVRFRSDYDSGVSSPHVIAGATGAVHHPNSNNLVELVDQEKPARGTPRSKSTPGATIPTIPVMADQAVLRKHRKTLFTKIWDGDDDEDEAQKAGGADGAEWGGYRV